MFHTPHPTRRQPRNSLPTTPPFPILPLRRQCLGLNLCHGMASRWPTLHLTGCPPTPPHSRFLSRPLHHRPTSPPTQYSAFPSPAEPYSHLGHVKLEQSIEEYPFPGLSQHHAEPSIPPTSDEGDWYPSSLADLHPAPAPKCVPLRITGASADMRRQMGVFRLDPFAMHDGVHAAVKRPLSPGGNSGGLAAPSALRLRDQAVCWNGEHAGPLKEPSVLVEFQVSPFPPSRLAWLLTFRSGAAQRSRKSGPVPGTICASL
jgi:hypothetical protein